MDASRQGERERGKSDQIDAVAIARAVVKNGVERFPSAYLDERAMEIRLLADHREALVRERTQIQNRLRWQLLDICPDVEAKLAAGSLSHLRNLERLDRRLRRAGTGARVRVARAQLAQIRTLTRQIDQLHSELTELIIAYKPKLLDELGCGTLTAAILIGHTAGAERFRTDACFARQAGTAPIPCSSGKRTQHRLDRGGDRQLNRALHTIAITRAQRDQQTIDYLERKQAEGNTRKGAYRSLKRHRARRFWRLLAEPPLPAKTPADTPPPAHRARPTAARRPVQKIAAAPNPGVCIG